MRRSILAFLVLVGVAPMPAQVRAQSGLTDAQRKSYAQQFQAAPPPSGQASPRELRTLLDAQEMRMTAPADKTKFRSFLQESPSMQALADGQTPELGYLLSWNEVALQATALDHYNTNPANPPPSYAEQFGPTRSSRALAIVHLAMFEAVNTISRKYQSYKGLQTTIVQQVGVPTAQISAMTASKNRALVEAGYQSLAALYPFKKTLFENARDLHVAQLGNPTDPAIVLGATIGEQAAKAVLALRCDETSCFDGSDLPDLTAADFGGKNPRTWHQDPITKLDPALGGNWHRVTPFVIPTGDAFRSVLRDPTGIDGDPTRRIPEAEMITAYKEVKRLGGDPHAPTSGDRWPTPTVRAGADDPDTPASADFANQTFVAIFWGYDGTALLCAPPRMYNMIATSIALNERPITSVEEMSVYLALVNVTLADAGIAAWDGKFHYLLPRPVNHIRDLKADDTAEGARDPRWTPLGAPVTNGVEANRNLTPPFPSYPSGHAVFGAAVFEVIRSYFTALDASFPAVGIPFTFVSDEYNGFNRAPGASSPRARLEAHFDSFDQAATLNAQSRIYLGIHWQFDADDGIKQGKAVAQDIFPKFVKPVP